MRLIDADTLLANIHNAMCADCNDECAACQWRDAIRLIEEAPTVGEWISVDDRLPEEDSDALVCNKQGIVFSDWFKFGIWQLGSMNISYWMPLPEPPEEVSVDGQR